MRHAVALDREAWSEGDQSRPLTEFGWRQSLAIAEVLADRETQVFFSSPTVRCADTLLPAAHGMGQQVQPQVLLVESNEPTSDPETAELLRQLLAACLPEGVERAAACTHGNLLIPLLSRLGLPTRCPKGGLWRLDTDLHQRVLGVEFLGHLSPRSKEWSR